MMKYVKLFALFLMIAFCSFCNAQNKTELPTGNTKSETKEVITSHGPNNITRTIKQDRHGNIWVASWEGIFRYDGKSFTNITNKVSSARFFSVLEDRKGNLWFGLIARLLNVRMGKIYIAFTFFLQAVYYCLFHSYVRLVTQNQSSVHV